MALYHAVKTACLGKSGSRIKGQKLQKWAEQLGNRVQNGRLTIDLQFRSSDFNNFSGNVIDTKRVETDEFCYMFVHSCPGMTII